VFAASILLLGFGSPTSMSGSAKPRTPQVVVHVKQFEFVPAEITLRRSTTVKLVLISEDVTHGLAVKGLGIETEIQKGHRTELMLTPTEIGDFAGSCTVFCGNGHRDMEFVIHVVD